MTDKEHEILTILMEECAEVIQAAAKVKRFGASSVYNGETAMDSLEKELGDLQCMLDIMHSFDMITYKNLDRQARRKAEKLKDWSNIFNS